MFDRVGLVVCPQLYLKKKERIGMTLCPEVCLVQSVQTVHFTFRG